MSLFQEQGITRTTMSGSMPMNHHIPGKLYLHASPSTELIEVKSERASWYDTRNLSKSLLLQHVKYNKGLSEKVAAEDKLDIIELVDYVKAYNVQEKYGNP